MIERFAFMNVVIHVIKHHVSPYGKLLTLRLTNKKITIMATFISNEDHKYKVFNVVF